MVDHSAARGSKYQPSLLSRIFDIESSDRRLGILLVAPALLIILFVNAYPIVLSAYQSTFAIRGLQNTGFIGLQNYIDLLGSERLRNSLLATAYFTFGAVFIQAVLGMIVALALNVQFRGRAIVTALMIVPWAIPSSIAALMWQRFLNATDGYVNATLRMMGILEGNMSWFSDAFLALTMVIMVDSWKMTPLYALIFLGALKAIPKSLYEAAAMEGAGRIKTFFYVTLPILKPVIVIVLILRTMLVFHAFDAIYILTQGGPGDSTRVIAYYAYQEAFAFLQYGRGAAMAIIVFVLSGLITYAYIKFTKFSTK